MTDDYEEMLFHVKKSLGRTIITAICDYYRDNDMDPLDAVAQSLVKDTLKSLIDDMPAEVKPQTRN